jgi:colanic acid/amylovoran biosynthesis glycosyltransferase
LNRLGVACDLVSTRRPRKECIAHSWSREAMARTTYLWPLTAVGLLSTLRGALFAGPSAWLRAVRALLACEDKGFRRRLKLVGLLLASGHLATLGRLRGWHHLHVHSCAESANLAMFAHLLSGLKYSVTLHGPLRDYGPNQALKWHFASSTVGHSATRRLTVAPMGVDLQTFERATLYQPWREGNPYYIFSCGRLNPCKGYEYLIGAVALLHERGIDARLSIAGAEDSTGRYRSDLEQMIARLGIGAAVVLLGPLTEEAVRQQLEVAHVFSLASVEEPLGVATMEAMSMNVPVVVTRQGGVPELVQDGIDGILVDAKSTEELARGLEFVARNPTLAISTAQAARQKIARHFSSENSARAIVQMLKEVSLECVRSENHVTVETIANKQAQ